MLTRILNQVQRDLVELKQQVDYLVRQEPPRDFSSESVAHRAPVDHFSGTTLDPVWNWSGTPFETPAIIDLSATSLMQIGSMSSANTRAFLYQEGSPTKHIYAGVSFRALSLNYAIGLRMDDDSDNNYVESLLVLTQVSPTIWTIKTRYRTGGGAVTEILGNELYLPHAVILQMETSGTRFTNWTARTVVQMPFNYGTKMWLPSGPTGLTWAPARHGLVLYQGDTQQTWARGHFDFYEF